MKLVCTACKIYLELISERSSNIQINTSIVPFDKNNKISIRYMKSTLPVHYSPLRNGLCHPDFVIDRVDFVAQ